MPRRPPVRPPSAKHEHNVLTACATPIATASPWWVSGTSLPQDNQRKLPNHTRDAKEDAVRPKTEGVLNAVTQAAPHSYPISKFPDAVLGTSTYVCSTAHSGRQTDDKGETLTIVPIVALMVSGVATDSYRFTQDQPWCACSATHSHTTSTDLLVVVLLALGGARAREPRRFLLLPLALLVLVLDDLLADRKQVLVQLACRRTNQRIRIARRPQRTQQISTAQLSRPDSLPDWCVGQTSRTERHGGLTDSVKTRLASGEPVARRKKWKFPDPAISD